MIDIDLTHGKHHFYDLRIDGNVLSKQYVPAFKLCLSSGRIFLSVCRPEFLDHIIGKKRLCNKAVNTGALGFFQHIVPFVGGDDDDRRFVTDDLPYLSCCFNAVHFGHFQVYQKQIKWLLSCLPEPYQLYRLPARKNSLAGDTRLTKYQLCVFTGNRIIIYDKHTQFTEVYIILLRVAFGICRIHERDRYGKCSTLALFALHLDVAVHQLDKVFGNRHSKPRASVSVGGRAVLLTEGIKQLRQVFRTHTDTRVGYCKTQSRSAVKMCSPFNRKFHASALGGELDGIAENIDQHLPQLHIVTDITGIHRADNTAIVVQSLICALRTENRVDLFKQL